MQAIVDDLSVNYDKKGKGRLVLLLHGWGDEHRTFRFIATELEKHFELVSLDLPGFGGSQIPPTAWTLDDYNLFIKDFLAKLKLGDPYAVIGHSNGGALAIRGLSLGEFKADKLVLLASAGVRNSQPAKKALTKTVAKVGKVTTFWMGKDAKDKMRKALYGTVGSDLLAVPALEETFKLTVKQDVQTDAAKLKLPTLIINADQDPAIPLADGERFHKLIKGSKLEVITSTDHFIHHSSAAKVAELILEFL